LFALGKNDYADVTPFHNDAFFRDCLKLSTVPSEETLRQRLDELAQAQEIPEVIKFSNVEMLKKVSYFGTEKTTYDEYIPLRKLSPAEKSKIQKTLKLIYSCSKKINSKTDQKESTEIYKSLFPDETIGVE
jgi:hypothetical protein